jgi:hypothetical protein
MFKFRNLLAIGLALVMLAAFMIPLTSAQPAQQATETPEATATATVVSPIATPEATAMVVSPTATAISTPGTLPTTGGRDGGAAILSLIVVAVGALMVVGGVGLVMSRRTR